MTELFNKVNWVDVITLILLIRIGYVSSKVGVGKQILPFLFLVGILVFSLYFTPEVASWVSDRFIVSCSIIIFFLYSVMMGISFLLYRVALFMSGSLSTTNEIKTGQIEKISGAVLGLLRATIIIGLVIIWLLFVPIRFVEYSVKDSYSASFFIKANIKVYNTLINLVFRNDKISHRKTLASLYSGKDLYIFESPSLKEKSRFFKEEY